MNRPLRHTRRGTGPDTVLFVHGTMDHSGSCYPIARRLSTWTVVAYDRRGWGTSRALASPRTTLADHVADLAAALASLPRPVVAGHSYGALVALATAAQHPQLIRAVVAFEPPLPWLPWWPPTAPWEQLVNDASQNPAEAARDLQQAVTGRPATGTSQEELAQLGTALIREMTDAAISEPTFDPLTMTTPVLTASGTRSLTHHQETSLHLADLLPAGHHEPIQGAGHIAHVTHPRHFAALIQQAHTPHTG
ncbi:alpha/beta fold hydrolase [Streptomyces kanamyceticus]|uniref:Alpha/beta hydrolase n=1 Tax=Streptomyces kanamyceticus TaxID=1967 RepID=A0A5J6GA23_STRKN|nr:alpha/beta hydrolase [Streptomyces kanamyceticus]QEU90768.1 alpha/beta hydrolase [Streptomyces kanamyceticus]